MDVLSPLKECTKHLEGQGKAKDENKDEAIDGSKPRSFGAIAEIIPVFEYLLTILESRLQSYNDVVHNVHNEAPKDHLVINLRAANSKACDYYNKLDNTPAYYAATILHPQYKNYCDVAWEHQPDWLELNNRNFQVLWGQYCSLPKPRTHTRAKVNNINNTMNSLIDPNRAVDEENEFNIWKRRKPQVEAGSDSAKFPTKYWIGLQDRYPNLSKLALNVLSILASSCECEQVFSELGDLLELRRRKISPELLAAIHCSRRWRRAGFGSSEVNEKEQLTVEQLISKYHVDTWDRG
jgi:hypothetical protein